MGEGVTNERRLEVALYYGQFAVIEELLAEDPRLASSTFALQLATYDLDAVKARLASDREAATRLEGSRPPMAHLCFSSYHAVARDRRDAMLAIAEVLVEHGADPDTRVPAGAGEPPTLSVLYGALGHAGNLPLARWLLTNGASPNDFESLYHATELGHLDGVRLLLEHGADPLHTNALLRAIDMNDVEMVTMLLEAGADPDDPFGMDTLGTTTPSPPALWHAARNAASGAVAESLIAHGATLDRPWRGRDAFGTALVYGASDVVEVLRAHGAERPVTDHEALLAACVSGAVVPEDARIESRLVGGDDRTLPHTIAARPGAVPALGNLFRVGFDPTAVDDQGMPPLHVAAWEGLAENVAFLLTLPHDLGHRNAYGGDAMGTVIHGAEFCPHADQRDHVTCARLLLDAGAVPDPADVEASGAPDLVRLLRARA